MGGTQSNENKPKYDTTDYNKHRPGKHIYGIYKNAVYWRGDRVNGAHGIFFKSYTYGYGKDDKNVFYNGRKIEVKDFGSFHSMDFGYAKDVFNVYYNGMLII